MKAFWNRFDHGVVSSCANIRRGGKRDLGEVRRLHIGENPNAFLDPLLGASLTSRAAGAIQTIDMVQLSRVTRAELSRRVIPAS